MPQLRYTVLYPRNYRADNSENAQYRQNLSLSQQQLSEKSRKGLPEIDELTVCLKLGLDGF